MQNDIISEILEVEDNATKLVDEARQKANRMIANAELESAKQLKSAIKERRLSNHEKLEEIRKKNKAEIKTFEESVKDKSVVDTKCIEKLSASLAKKICNSSVFDK